jgi:hypothetical protein
MTKRLRPALRGSWVLLLGLALSLAAVKRGVEGADFPWPWAFMAVFFLLLSLHRHSLVYALTPESLTVESWWGLGRPERVSLARLERVEILRGLTMRLCGCGHLHLRSSLPDEGSVVLTAQPRPDALAAELEAMSRAAKDESGPIIPSETPSPDETEPDRLPDRKGVRDRSD